MSLRLLSTFRADLKQLKDTYSIKSYTFSQLRQKRLQVDAMMVTHSLLHNLPFRSHTSCTQKYSAQYLPQRFNYRTHYMPKVIALLGFTPPLFRGENVRRFRKLRINLKIFTKSSIENFFFMHQFHTSSNFM